MNRDASLFRSGLKWFENRTLGSKTTSVIFQILRKQGTYDLPFVYVPDVRLQFLVLLGQDNYIFFPG